VRVNIRAEFLQVLHRADKQLVVVDYFAKWCPPCQKMVSFYEQLAKKFPKVTFIIVDVDENKETARHADIEAYPTYHFYIEQRLVHEVEGADRQELFDSVEATSAAAERLRNQQPHYHAPGCRHYG